MCFCVSTLRNLICDVYESPSVSHHFGREDEFISTNTFSCQENFAILWWFGFVIQQMAKNQSINQSINHVPRDILIRNSQKFNDRSKFVIENKLRKEVNEATHRDEYEMPRTNTGSVLRVLETKCAPRNKLTLRGFQILDFKAILFSRARMLWKHKNKRSISSRSINFIGIQWTVVSMFVNCSGRYARLSISFSICHKISCSSIIMQSVADYASGDNG